MGVYLGRNAVEVYGGGVKVKPEEEKTVTASTSVIEVTPTSGKTLKKVTVNPTPSEEKTVTPSASQQIVSPSDGKVLSSVTVNGDADLISANIKQGVNIFGVNGELLEEQVTIDGVKVIKPLSLSKYSIMNISISTLPETRAHGSSVVLNDKIYLLGGNYYTGNYTFHRNNMYSWDGLSWTNICTLPNNNSEYAWDIIRRAVVYNNEIHAITASNPSSTNSTHYKWNGSAWTKVSTIPHKSTKSGYAICSQVIGEIDGKIAAYITDIEYDTYSNPQYYYLYFWNGKSWEYITEFPNQSFEGIVFNDEVHIFGDGNQSSYNKHYKWNGSAWTLISTLSFQYLRGSICVFNNEIHILGSTIGGTSTYKQHYKWDGSEWTKLSDLPVDHYDATACVYKEHIHLLGGYSSDLASTHYALNVQTYMEV